MELAVIVAPAAVVALLGAMFLLAFAVGPESRLSMRAGRRIVSELGRADQDIVRANLAAVEAHFHSEASNEVEQALDLYTDDVVWEAPARKLRFEGKRAVANNYRKMFAVMRDVEFRNLQRFATEDRVVDDSVVTFTLTGPGFLPLPVGQKVEMRLVHIFEMRDSKIAKEIGFEMWRPV